MTIYGALKSPGSHVVDEKREKQKCTCRIGLQKDAVLVECKDDPLCPKKKQ